MRKHKIYDENITGATKAVGAQLHYIINDTSKAGAFVWADPAGSANVKDVLLNGPEDDVLVLRTSGTTSRPKVVPLTLGGILLGAKCISSALGLKPTDRTL